MYAGAVPVVWGAKKQDFIDVIPEHSFIHVDDFETNEKLAKYLIYLTHNDTAYNEYFKWREWFAHPELIEEKFKKGFEDRANSRLTLGFCSVCRLVIEEKKRGAKGLGRTRFTVPSIGYFWYGMENPECRLQAQKQV